MAHSKPNIPGFFLDPARERYIVVSVDPAGGGVLSDEVFVLFLVADDQFGLLSGYVASGHNKRHPFAAIPMVFILSLLRVLQNTHRLLRQTHVTFW